MRKKIIAFICLFQFLTIAILAQVKTQERDSLSLNDRVNLILDSILKSQEPSIKFQFYKNGKKIKRGFSMKALLRDSVVVYKNDKKILLFKEKIAESDSINITFGYKKRYFIKTNDFPLGKMKYGGKIYVGIITNFQKELRQYLKDSIGYINQNLLNKLGSTMSILNRRNSEGLTQGSQLIYMRIEFSTTKFIGYKYVLINKNREIINLVP